MTRAEVIDVGTALDAALEALLELDGACCVVVDCCSKVDDGVVEVEAGCCCVVEEAAAAGVVDGAFCADVASDVAGDGAAAVEVVARAGMPPVWRGKMFSVGERSVSTLSPRGTRIRIRKPARVTRMPKVCADSPPRIFGRRERRGWKNKERKRCSTANWEY